MTALSKAVRAKNKQVALILIANGADIGYETDAKLEMEFIGLSMPQAAVQAGLTERLQVLLESYPSVASHDQPEALVKLALAHARSDVAAFLQSLIASRAIDDMLTKPIAATVGVLSR